MREFLSKGYFLLNSQSENLSIAFHLCVNFECKILLNLANIDKRFVNIYKLFGNEQQSENKP